ncbi:MAG: hypothetical protein OEZ08_08190, partial [Betaproteobacteria bacterium]|nr:hypothetical protein [Betaproteobacteria bacterium]
MDGWANNRIFFTDWKTTSMRHPDQAGQSPSGRRGGQWLLRLFLLIGLFPWCAVELRAAASPVALLDEQRLILAQTGEKTSLPRPYIARPPPGRARAIVAVRTTEAPLIDGRIDEAVWERAAVADQFWVSEQNRAPAEPTEARVLFDSDTLYISFRVFDRVPERIEGLQIRRDAGLGFDDAVTVEIDAAGNYRDISKFSVNARGTQQDEIAGGRARRIEWKGDWQAAAVRTIYGWSAEIAIPFQMLAYP